MYSVDLVSSEQCLKELWQMDQIEYSDSNVPYESFARWWQQYDLGLRIALRNEQIMGAIGLWALSEKDVRLLIAGKQKESDMLPVSCEQLEVEPSPFWYISGIFIKQHKSLGSPLRRLLQSGVGSWANSSHVKLPCHCYALGYSSEGIELLHRFKFEQIKTASETADGLPLYWRQFDRLSDFRSVLP